MNQEVALKILKSGQSAFLTGPAGAGKTYVLNEFIKFAKKKHLPVAKTATTGLAATHLSGNTIHAWSGIGINKTIPHRFFDKLSKTRRETICRASILIIDEISMMHDYLLDAVNEICKIVREDDSPFGGLQVVMAGDFAQLPPINRADDKIKGNFAYLSKAWEELNPAICYLSTQYRQEDQDFLDILNAIRENNVRRHHAETLLERVGAETSDVFTELHTTNFNVDKVNDRRLADIYEEEMTYEMTHTGSEGKVQTLKRSVLAPEILRLKIGATVMALKNDPSQRFVNGSIGKIIDFEEGTGYPVVEFNSGRTATVGYDTWEMRDGERKVAGVTQIPLRLAWAITVHKSQGMTLDSAVLDLRHTFAPGMGYVALSRVKNLNSMSLLGIGKTALKVSPEAVKMNALWKAKSEKLASEIQK
ncbi:AAA family ATPase [Candidatus Saccharibacteria bacterium]|nr:AAA family ATPase [Candidatus Saccharibacteria bacterium]